MDDWLIGSLLLCLIYLCLISLIPSLIKETRRTPLWLPPSNPKSHPGMFLCKALHVQKEHARCSVRCGNHIGSCMERVLNVREISWFILLRENSQMFTKIFTHGLDMYFYSLVLQVSIIAWVRDKWRDARLYRTMLLFSFCTYDLG